MDEEKILEEIHEYMAASVEVPGTKEPNTITAPEVKAHLKISTARARGLLKRLATLGVMEPAKVWRVTEWGFRRKVIGYRRTQ